MPSEIRFAVHPDHAKNLTAQELRAHFLIEDLFNDAEPSLVYSMYDRMVTIGITAPLAGIQLPAFEPYTKASFFLERRELGIINIGGNGKVEVDGQTFTLRKKECLYVGKGKRNIVFQSESAESPALFYGSSCPAHHNYPTTKATVEEANQVNLGNQYNSNQRTIYQFIHENGIQSCQLVMGFTDLKTGNVWNTFPPHTHLRRMEVYCYFDLPADQVVMHFMGTASETRHITMKNHQAVISPEWSIHAGAGTAAYSFIWSMAGENKAFADMDAIALNDIR